VEFDGQGHTISGLYFNDTDEVEYGLFRRIEVGGTVRNVGVIDSYFAQNNVRNKAYAGAIAGQNLGTIRNCYSNAILICSTYSDTSYANAIAGGITGYNGSGHLIENCYFTGSITVKAETDGTSSYSSARVDVGGIVGINYGTVRNCYSTAKIENLGAIAADPAKEKNSEGGVVGSALDDNVEENCYYLDTSETDSLEGTTFKTSEQFASGEVTYALNNGVVDGTQPFYQTLGVGTPALKGATVYLHPHCDGVNTVYSNSAVPEHQAEVVAGANYNEDGTCKVCGELATVKVVTVNMIIGSTVIYDTEYYSSLADAFASDKVMNSSATTANITLLKDVELNSNISVNSGNIILNTQTFNIENPILLGDVFVLTNNAKLTLKGSGTVTGANAAASVGGGASLTLSESVKLVGNTAVRVNGGTFLMNGGSLEGNTAVDYADPVKISITDGSIKGSIKDTSLIGSSEHPKITGGAFPGGITVSREYNRLMPIREVKSFEPVVLSCPGVTEIPQLGLVVTCSEAEKITNNENTFTVHPEGQLLLRSRCSGDEIKLPGGTKSLKKLFIDRKIPANQRPNVPVLADNGGVLGVYGIGVNAHRATKSLPAVQISIRKI
jgi:tRNA(Ile)-lysidine synthetase-like protein